MPALPDTLATLDLDGVRYHYYSLARAADALGDLSRLPISLKVLLENLLRHADGVTVSEADLRALAGWLGDGQAEREIAFRPARVLMQDFTGLASVVELAAMRDAVRELGGDVARINPLSPVDLVVDHSVMVDRFGDPAALRDNMALEMRRNAERYAFLRWGQQALDNFRVVPPGTGICHQVNLEHLARVVWTREVDGVTYAFPDTLVGTDSHTTMVNGLGVLGWGVGGIEAEAAMLGQPVSMLIPPVVGVRLDGCLGAGVTATDLVLDITQRLRRLGVVGKFVEFFGDGLAELPLADRATLANMAPEYGATCGFFPVDEETLAYLRLSGRDEAQVRLVEAYCKAQGLWREAGAEPRFSEVLAVDLGGVEACLAGPKRPQDRVPLAQVPAAFAAATQGETRPLVLDGQPLALPPGAVVIASITSCTNTSNPGVMLAAGLLARKARALGLVRQPWVKTSLAPGSKVVSAYLEASGLQADLDALGFNVVGYGCATCCGNGGALPEAVERALDAGDPGVASVLSGNRNFEGRIHPRVRTNWLASPPLVVAYALAGRVTLDLVHQPLGRGPDGQPVYLRDIWPSAEEIAAALASVNAAQFRREYAGVFDGDAAWRGLAAPRGDVFAWSGDSTYIQRPPFFDGMRLDPTPPADLRGARLLALLGDSVTTDHISPVGAIAPDSPAGRYLRGHGVAVADFNSYGSRRGNHEVMMRGTFANVRLRNEMLDGVEGGFTRHLPSGERLAIFDAAMRYAQEGTPLVVVAGREYGTGSSRDWAAKGTCLLGVRVVLAESFERIHRSNLIGMGVLPLQFPEGVTRRTLGLTGEETLSVEGIAEVRPGGQLRVSVSSPAGRRTLDVLCRLDTANELAYYRHGGILHYVLRGMLARP